MSGSMTDRLAKFTPDGSGVDRDALLWEAGRTAGRRGRGTWMAVAGFLAITQAVTLAFLWPESPEPEPMPITKPPAPAVEEPPPSDVEPPPMVRRWELPPQPGGIPDLVPPGQPLTVYPSRGNRDSDLWNF